MKSNSESLKFGKLLNKNRKYIRLYKYVNDINESKSKANLAQIIHNIEQIDPEASLKNQIINSYDRLFLSTMTKAEQFRKCFD